MELMVVRGRSYFCQSPKSGGGGQEFFFFFNKTAGFGQHFFFKKKKTKIRRPSPLPSLI